ncbi:MAG: hypothetical protein HYV26_01730 [Candidatus Hydrogenedentes bacterium]|nr:hypothetical protein [Candidatus Hydrogenedentota bacterium]
MTNPITVPLWLGGLYFGLFHPQGKRFRWLALAFVIVFLLLSLSYGKGYYLAPAFPMVFALGGVGFEHLTVRRRVPRVIFVFLLAGFGALFASYVLPVLPIDTFLRFQSAIGITTPRQEVGHTGAIPQHFGDRFGWPEMVALVAKAYQELPAVDRQRCGILTSNYGEAGAINFFGREHGLPRAICGHNNYFLWGPGDATGEVMLVYNRAREELEPIFEEVREVGRFQHPYVMPYQQDRRLYLCRGLKIPIAAGWPQLKVFT